MPTYTIRERRGVGLDAFARSGRQIEFLLYRDALLIGPYDSRDDAERAIARFEVADKKRLAARASH